MSAHNPEYVRLLHIDRLHTEFWGGKWHWPSNAEPQAIVSYASEPSPETGHIGWVWWALGKMGEAATYDAAKTAAEESLRKQAVSK